VQARFLLGPAGSGKTFRCLKEARAALTKNPEGAPLIFLAPKQATFQIERQLLADPEISGYTRLHIFSFERLAKFILDTLSVAPPKFLSDEGRVMVLRALLMRHEKELKLFGRSARRSGFAQELGSLLNELQQHQFTPARLRVLAEQKNLRRELRDKLNDLALLHENYSHWLAENKLQDGNHLLDFVVGVLREPASTKNSKLKIQDLYLDGFAEMTPQELDLLAATIPFCESATLAFCLDAEPKTRTSWLSIWNSIGKTFQQCRQRIENLPDCKIEIENLPRNSKVNRFAKNSELARLEKSWAQPNPESRIQNPESSVRIIECSSAEAEATFAAREILKFVRANPQNRFRDCAVLVRNLDHYYKPLARIFRRYEIPFFLDRRESVAHHPLAELTRSALRTITFDWQNDDLFAALKSGFCAVEENEIDALENTALEFGWRGKKWREPLPDESFERLRKKILPPFENLFKRLEKMKFQVSGNELAEILREFWDGLKVEQRLQDWSDEISDSTHSSVFEQMNLWLENLALAFPREQLPVRDWLPILEAGLANLTVGVIPPALDQVLVGAIDRARNPDLKLALVLGMNESVFPATPNSPAILTDSDRDELQIPLGPDLRERLARERFYAYIACTRASEKLRVTFSRSDAGGKTLNPSPFIAQLQNILPELEVEEFSNVADWREAESANELIEPLVAIQNSKFKIQNWETLLELPALKSLAEELSQLREPDLAENLSPSIAENLFVPTLRTSVSRMEEFAACPFRFFVRSGLRADERKVFEFDARERGNFQHDVLKIFHEQLQAEGKHWRDLTSMEARERVGKIATEQMEHFHNGLLRDSAEAVFAARAMAAALQDFVEVIVGWMRSQYEFDPVAAELDFGGRDSDTPPWEIDLSSGHKLALQGRIDRVDLWRDAENNSALAVVTDYKSGGNKLDSLLVENGVQLQLLAYLGALRRWKDPRAIFGAGKIIPVGAFYVSLQGKFDGGDTRDEILGDVEAKKLAYRHNGRFDAGALRKFDRRSDVSKGDQFNFKLNKDGGLPSNSSEALPRDNFNALLDNVEEKLRAMGKKVFSGEAKVDPYRKGRQTPCEFCDYQAACRIDKWTHQYRVLRATTTNETD
jgi:ATP-dependent helicase/nuclease subunit B